MEIKMVDILLVEDRAEDAELCIMALEDCSLANKLHWVKDGQEAIDFLFGENSDKKRPKLILLDNKMPKMNGIEVLRKIRENEATKTLPVVMLTTSKHEQDMISAYNLGVNSYILKPVIFDKFLKSVKDIGMYWLLLNEPPIK